MGLIIDLAIVILLFNTQNENQVSCTIDVNLSELEYLASHLETSECRRLVAALHYNTFELPESIAAAERKVDEDIPCLRQLLHWNISPGEGRGETHEAIEHRLRQINRNDLADWLGKTTFRELGNDLGRAIGDPFGFQSTDITESQSSAFFEPTDEPAEEDPWLPVDTLLFAAMVLLFVALIIVYIATVIHWVKLRRHQQNNYRIIDQERGSGADAGIGDNHPSRKKKKKKLKTKNRKMSATTPRKSKDDSTQDSDLLLQAKNEKGCCGTVSCIVM